MFVAGQNVFHAEKIPIKRKGFVLRAIFHTIMNVMSKNHALTQIMMDNLARIFTLEA